MEMKNKFPIILASPVAFCKNENLVNELKSEFSGVIINENLKRYSQEELVSVLGNCDGAIIGLEKVNQELFEKCPKLKVISKYGVGLDNINFQDCDNYGIQVKFTPGVNKTSVAELTLSLMLGLMRNSYLTSNQLKEGIWNKSGGFDLTNKTIGIIGVGNVGKELVRFLSPFNCKLLVNDIRRDEEQLNFYQQHNLRECSTEEIYKYSDIISLHVPLTSLTQGMINNTSLNLMKSSAYLINTARGPIVNEEDLFYTLTNKKIAGAGLDVYSQEPPTCEGLLSLENVICTPHIAGNSQEAVLAMGRAAIGGLKEFFEK